MSAASKATIAILRRMQQTQGGTSSFAGARMPTTNNMSRTGRRYLNTIKASPKPAPGELGPSEELEAMRAKVRRGPFVFFGWMTVCPIVSYIFTD